MDPNNEVDINAPSEALLKVTEPEQPVAPVSVSEPEPIPIPAPTDASQDTGTHLSPIRTYSSDMAEAIRSKGGSVVRIAIAEEEKRRRAYEDNSIRSKKNVALLVTGFVIIAASIGVAWYGYESKKAAQTVAPVAHVAPPSLVTSEDWTTIDVTGLQVTDVLAKVQALRALPGMEDGTVKNVILTRKTAAGSVGLSASEFLSFIAPKAPSDLVRALKSDWMLGVYQHGAGNLFMVVHGTAHDFLLAGMLSWENKGLLTDMAPLFGIDLSGYSKDELSKLSFQDTLIENRDARAVLDADGKPIMYYSFIDQNTIVFATDPKTLPEVVRRY